MLARYQSTISGRSLSSSIVQHLRGIFGIRGFSDSGVFGTSSTASRKRRTLDTILHRFLSPCVRFFLTVTFMCVDSMVTSNIELHFSWPAKKQHTENTNDPMVLLQSFHICKQQINRKLTLLVLELLVARFVLGGEGPAAADAEPQDEDAREAEGDAPREARHEPRVDRVEQQRACGGKTTVRACAGATSVHPQLHGWDFAPEGCSQSQRWLSSNQTRHAPVKNSAICHQTNAKFKTTRASEFAEHLKLAEL